MKTKKLIALILVLTAVIAAMAVLYDVKCRRGKSSDEDCDDFDCDCDE
jgi:hypothetical protein